MSMKDLVQVRAGQYLYRGHAIRYCNGDYLEYGKASPDYECDLDKTQPWGCALTLTEAAHLIRKEEYAVGGSE